MQRQFDEIASRPKTDRARPCPVVARLLLLLGLALAVDAPSSADAQGGHPQRLGPAATVEPAPPETIDDLVPVGSTLASAGLSAAEISNSAEAGEGAFATGELLPVAGAAGGAALLTGGFLIERFRRLAAGRRARAAEARMALVAASGDLGFWGWEADGDQLSADENCRRLLGLAPGRAVGLRTLFKSIHPEDRGRVWRDIETAIRAGNVYSVTYRTLGAEGAARWILASGSGERDEKGNPSKLTGMVVDVSARRQAEAEAAARRDELAHLARVTILGELSTALAHELNQPLTAILSNAQAALRLMESGAADPDEIREILSDIVEDDGRAVEIIRRMRALLRKGAVDRLAIDPNDLLKDVAALMRNELAQRQVRLVLQLGPNLPGVTGDPIQLQQVLINFILNGCDAMQHKHPRERVLTLTGGADGTGGLIVSVADQGAGIAPEIRTRLFEPFVTTKPEGLGLGLSISRSILTAHGGRIWAESNARGGATFCFALPAGAGKSRVVAA
jgi:PAS domain S-box-containing protein